MFATWLRRRRDRYYLFFSLAIASWSIYILNMFVREIWLPTGVWEWFAHFSVEAWVIAFCVFAYLYTGLDLRKIRWFYGAYILGVGVFYAVIPLATLDWVVMYTHAFSMAIGAHMIFHLFKAAHRLKSGTLYLISGGLVVLLVTGIHDWIFQSGLSGVTGTFPLHLHYYCAPLVFGFIAWHLTSRFSVALNEAEILNRELEYRVSEAEETLEQRYAQISEFEKSHAVMMEQDRLSKEIHDGVGGSLANAIMLTDLIDRSEKAERVPQLKSLLEGALSEVRHLISAMAGDISTTTELSQYLLERAQPMVDAMSQEGVQINLIMSNLLSEDLPLSSNQGLNLARIGVEAINNSFRHANAENIWIELADIPGGVVFSISDDGVGFESSAGTSRLSKSTGYGLKNMMRRARDIGAELDLAEREAGGTDVRITLELQNLLR
ncbi:MAG: hypothetical protein GKR90_01330 [Pseudomonadales bacterium]|nr:hypothetical protein [Pseudomonadales bacterium]